MLKKYFILSTLALGSIFILDASTALADDTPKWGSHVEAEGKWGTDRSLGEAGLFMPVWQNEDTLVFTDLRGRFDDQGSSEGNFGLGVRYKVSNQWALGGYGFYDRRRTENDNNFSQATIGVEALAENLEFRVNGYIPESTEKDIGNTSSAASISGANFQISNLSAPKERGLPGFDVEAGYGFELPEGWQFWGYAGGFHFDADNYENVSGPRGRIELSYDNVPHLGEGSRFTLGVESQTDNVRGGQSFGIARLRIPLNVSGTQSKSLYGLDKRMTTRIIRDIDIVAGDKAAEVTSTESATLELEDGTQVASFTTIDANDDMEADVTAAGANALIVADGSAGIINVSGDIRPLDGQTILGGGATVTVQGSTSGNTATVTMPGTRPTINGTSAGDTVFFLPAGAADNVRLQNMSITGGNRGIVFEADNSILQDIVIQNTGNDSILVNNNATGSVFENLTLSNPDGGDEEAIQFNAGAFTNLTLRDITVQDANVGFIFAIGGTSDAISFEDVSVDNVTQVVTVQGGVTLDNPSGAITATNVGGTACSNSGTINNSTLTINGVTCN